MWHEVSVVGNLGRDPEMRYLDNGTAVTNFSVAANRKYTGADKTLVEETVWFRVSVFGKTAETCNQYLKKGSLVLVVGKLRPDPASGGPRIWKAQDGTSKASFDLSANEVKFLDKKEGGGPSSTAQSKSSAPGEASYEDDLGIPF